jgi:hypothetical protein
MAEFQEKLNKYANDFKEDLKSMLQLLKELINVLYNNGKLTKEESNTKDIDKFLFALELVNGSFLITNFIKNSQITLQNNTKVNLWDYLRQKDEKFFVDNLDVLFPHEQAKSVCDKFKIVFPKVDNDSKKIVWDFLHALVKESIFYVHYKRVPGVNPQTNKKKYSYMNEFPTVDIIYELRSWSLSPSFTS